MDEGIRDVMREEKHRGRKHVLDLEAQKERQALLRDFGKLLKEGTEEENRSQKWTFSGNCKGMASAMP